MPLFAPAQLLIRPALVESVSTDVDSSYSQSPILCILEGESRPMFAGRVDRRVTSRAPSRCENQWQSGLMCSQRHVASFAWAPRAGTSGSCGEVWARERRRRQTDRFPATTPDQATGADREKVLAIRRNYHRGHNYSPITILISLNGRVWMGLGRMYVRRASAI